MWRLWNALLYSIDGLKAAWRDEAAFRLEVMIAVVMLPAACFVAQGAIELALLWGSIFIVMMAELLNSAVEAAIDRMGEEIHPLSKKAKDTASAAVLLALFNCAAIWGAVLFF